MGYAYAYIQKGTVLEVEKRTIQDTEDYPIGRYYNGALLPFFVEIRPGDNAPEEAEVKRGWVYSENTFHEPRPFEINSETGELYLPPSISAEMFWGIFSENMELKNQLETTTAVVNDLLLTELEREGAIV